MIERMLVLGACVLQLDTTLAHLSRCKLAAIST